MPRQLQGHQLDHRHGIRRRPGRDGRIEQEHLRRAAPQGPLVDLGQPRIHPVGIGAQRRRRARILHRHRLLRQTIEVQPPDQRVDTHRALPEDLRQPPLHRAPHRYHLPQTVLRMGIAQPVEHIRVRDPEDMRHIGIVAHDLDRRLRPGRAFRDHHGPVVIRQGPAREPEHQRKPRHHQKDHPPGNPQQPLENPDHPRPVLDPCIQPVS
jgi:hypothetical protein